MSPSSTTRVPPALFLAAGIAAVFGVVAIGFGVLEGLATQPQRWVVGVTSAVALLAYGALLLVTANGLRRARRWSRGPAVATHLIHLPVAWGFREPPTTWVAVVLILGSAVVLVCLFLPRSTYALSGGGGLNGPEGQH